MEHSAHFAHLQNFVSSQGEDNFASAKIDEKSSNQEF